jgi:hypothetical protein
MTHIYDITESTFESLQSDERWSIILYLVSNKNTDFQFYIFFN